MCTVIPSFIHWWEKNLGFCACKVSIFNRLIKPTGDSEIQEGDLLNAATLERIKRFSNTRVIIHGPNEVLVSIKQEVGIANQFWPRCSLGHQ